MISLLDIDACRSDPCGDAGSCINDGYSFVCECYQQFTGSLCNSAIEKCNTEECIHGSCTAGENGLFCLCEIGYKGVNCDIGSY